MGRKVSVGLEADVAGFVRPVESAKKAVDDLGAKVDSLDRSLNKIPADAAKAGAAMKLLGGDVGSVGEKVNSLGEKNTGLAVLDSKIRQTKSEVKKLAEEFVKTGDIDVFRKLGDAEGRLRGLETVRKKLKDALVVTPEESKGLFAGWISDAKKLGEEFGKNFSAGFQGILSNPITGPAIAIPLAAAVVSAMAFVGAAIGGAVLGGLGAAAAGGGLLGAWMGDPGKFSAQWNTSLDNLERRASASSKAFSEPLERALKEVDRAMRDLPVEKILALSQSFVDPLVQGAGGGITNIASGLADALEKVQPVIDKLGPGLANLGNDIGDTFRMISEGSEGGADALGDLIAGIGYTIRAIGLLILGFEKAYENIRGFVTSVREAGASIPVVGGFMSGLTDSLFGIRESAIVAGRALTDAGDASHNTAFDWGEMGKAAAAAAVETLGLNDALTKTRNTMLGMADANLAVAQGWLDLKQGLDDGKKSLDATTQAGIENQKNILTQVELLERQRQKAIETGGGTVEAVNAANAAYDAGIQKLKDTAHAAGFTDAQVDALLRSYGALPGEVKTDVKAPGLSSALAQGVALGNALNRIDGQVYEAQVVVRYHTIGQSLNAPLAHGGIRRAAVGMVIPPSDPGTTLVGEPQTGGEALIPLRGISQSRAMNLAQVVGSSYGFSVSQGGGGGLTLTLAFSGGNNDYLNRAVQRGFADGRIAVYAGGQRVQVQA